MDEKNKIMYYEILVGILVKKLGGKVVITPKEMEEGMLYLSFKTEREDSEVFFETVDIRKEEREEVN